MSLVKGLIGILLFWLLWSAISAAVVFNPNTVAARKIDRRLQNYAYRAFKNPRTGVLFDGMPPPDLSGIEISVMRLRSQSLYLYGVETFKEFRIPVGCREQPYVERLVIVYQNMENWSTTYYSLPNYSHLAPVLGLLAYNGSDLAAVDLAPIDFWASKEAIVIKFEEVNLAPAGWVAQCVWYSLTGVATFRPVINKTGCLTTEQGHFSIVGALSAPVPEIELPDLELPKRSLIDRYYWLWGGIIGSVGVGLEVVIFCLIISCVCKVVRRYRGRNELQVQEMEMEMTLKR